MFLKYGISPDNQLVYVEQAQRGTTDLKCPYCGGILIAKKGDIKTHHFAHAGATCKDVERDDSAIELPAYDNFNLHLSPKVLQELREFNADGYKRYSLENLRLIQRGYGGDNWELSKLGKIPLGLLSLQLFNEVQNDLIMRKHFELEKEARDSWQRGYPDLPARLADLRIYRAQIRRILTTTLYFLGVQHNGGVLHKIGVTTRNIEARIAEIRRDLTPILGDCKIEVLGTWAHRGNVELYFKHRYAQHQKRIGLLTEYFEFPELKPVLSYDLRRMKQKELDYVEQDIFDGLPSMVEQNIETKEIEERRRAGIKSGMQRAKQRGLQIGRPSITDDELIQKYPRAVQALREGMSIRKAAEYDGTASPATVQRIKRALDT